MRVKTAEKRKQFVDAGGRLFIEQGYAAVSMEGIAAEAGMSKVTLYNYFSSKEDLFEAFVKEAGAGAVEALTNVYADNETAKSILSKLGMSLLRLVTRTEVIALDRLIMGEAKRYPALARIFFENGPKRTTAALVDVIGRCMASGKMTAGDAHLAALHFKGLCTTDVIEAQMWGLTPPPTEAQLRAVTKSAVEAFLNGYR
jgi:TetR/AcrR family transcriptional repressor of mexJK operon